MLRAPAWRIAGRASSAAADQPAERDTADERGQRRRRHWVLLRLSLELLDHRADATAISAIGGSARRALGRDVAVAFAAANRACLLGLRDQLVLLGKGVALELVGFVASPRLHVGFSSQRL